MTKDHADFAVVGSTPLARLLAGLLVSVHGRRVVFRGESQAGYRLPRSIDLSVAPVTRPETWALLKRGVPETMKLLGKVGGRGAWSRADPILMGGTAAAREGLAHIRHMAQAFGHAAERLPEKVVGAGHDGIVLRDAVLLHRPTLETSLDRWLDQLGVRRLGDADSLTLRADGSAQVQVGEDQVDVGQTVLADDSAILAFLPQHQWPDLLRPRIHSTIATEPTRPIAAPVMHRLDTGLTLVQQAGRGVAALGPGAMDPFAAALGALLGKEHGFRQAGQSSYQALAALDGAPAVGRVGGTGPDVVAGLGISGAFLAPAIARWLCGVAEPVESAWLGARLVDRQAGASVVSEFESAA